MKVEAEVKIKILDGKEQGKIDTFTTVGETDSLYTEYGIIERLRLEWRYIHNAHLIEPQESEDKNGNTTDDLTEKNCKTCGQKCAIKNYGCSNWIPKSR